MRRTSRQVYPARIPAPKHAQGAHIFRAFVTQEATRPEASKEVHMRGICSLRIVLLDRFIDICLAPSIWTPAAGSRRTKGQTLVTGAFSGTRQASMRTEFLSSSGSFSESAVGMHTYMYM